MSPIPNHCIECDKPTMDILCDKCKEKEMTIKYHKRYIPEDGPVSNCCTASFTYPGWPDSDICNKCGEHADIGEDDG